MVSLDENRKPNAPEKAANLGRWHTVKGDCIYDKHDEFYRINNENTPLGFWAYLEPPKK